MGVLIMFGFFGGARNEMEMTFGSDAEPGMAAIMKWLWDAIQSDDVMIKIRAGLQIDYVEGNMIKLSHGLVALGYRNEG
jgi:hypothetical protein